MIISSELALSLLILIPLSGAGLILITRKNLFIRETVSILTSILLALNALWLITLVAQGERPELSFFNFGGLSLTFKLEPLGALFALVASGLWVLNTFFTIGYMRANQEKKQTQFYVFVCLSIAATMGVAASGNILTLFLFYEALSLSTFPLVAHKGDKKARKGAKVYLLLLMGTSLGLFLPAVISTYFFAGHGDFIAGGIFSSDITPLTSGVLLILYVFGIGKAAIMPVHSWLPNAMVAPTPVSALLHAVAVVKAGVFSILKVSLFIFGPETLQNTPVSYWLSWVAVISIILASCIALSKDNLKARLAYSTVSQLSYVTLGALLAVTSGFTGAALQIVMHAWGKITLFMGAGAIYTLAHYTHVSQLNGLGKKMPYTLIAFAIGSVSIIGLPPLGGSWSKFFLILASFETHHKLFILALMLSSVLNVLYLMPIMARAFFLNEPVSTSPSMQEKENFRKNGLLWFPPVLTALGSVLLFFLAGHIIEFLDPVLNPLHTFIETGQ